MGFAGELAGCKGEQIVKAIAFGIAGLQESKPTADFGVDGYLIQKTL
jgi:hypothetical protein